MAKSKVGTLAVDFIARTGKIFEGFNRVTKSVDKFKRSASKAFSKIKGAAFNLQTAILGLAGAAGFGALVKSSQTAIDALAKTSDKLGITTEALAKMRLAAELSGVKVTTMDMALQRMVRRLSEAANGTGEAKKAIEELGLDAQRLAAASPDKAFEMIAERMETVVSQSDKVRLAFKFFDSEGVALVNTLNLGSKALQDIGNEAEQFGIVISRLDAAKVEAANDSITKAKSIIKGLGNEAAIALAPIQKALVDSFVNAAKEAGGFEKVATGALNGVITAVGFVADALRGLEVVWLGLKTVVLGYGSAVASVISSKQVAADAAAAFGAARFRLVELANAEMPSTNIKQFVAEARAELDKLVGPEGEETPVIKAPVYEHVPKGTYDAQIQALADRNSRVEALATKHANMLNAITKKRADNDKRIQQQSAGAVVGILQGLTGLIGSSSKKQFELGKKLAKASIIVSTGQAIMNALAVQPYPLGVALAVGAGLKGAAELANVNRTTYSGGGGINAGGVSFPSPTAGNPPGAVAPASETAPQVVEVNITIDTVVGTQEYVDNELMPALQTSINQAGTVLIDPTSQNGLELQATI